MSKTVKYLIIGIIGGILTMIGDCLLLGADSTGAADAIEKYSMIASQVSYLRIGLAGSFGFVGIPVSVLGSYVLYMLTVDKDTRLAKLYRYSLYGFAATGGAIHIVCCYLVTGLKKDMEAGNIDLVMSVFEEQAGYLIPCFALFLAIYGIHVVTMFLLVIKKKTAFPAWFCVFNPLIFKIVINAIGGLGTNAFFNGLACSNMSLGSTIIFAVWLAAIYRRKAEWEQ